jgi:hypothetical protein
MKKDEIVLVDKNQGIANKPKNSVFQLEVGISIC